MKKKSRAVRWHRQRVWGGFAIGQKRPNGRSELVIDNRRTHKCQATVRLGLEFTQER